MFIKRIAALALCALLFACASTPKEQPDDSIFVVARCDNGKISVYIRSTGPGLFSFALNKDVCGIDI